MLAVKNSTTRFSNDSPASQIKTGLCGYRPNNQPFYDVFPTRNDILEEAIKIDGLNPILYDKLKEVETKEEILAASWCLDQFIPLSISKPYPWSIVFYEKIITNGEEEIVRLFNDINEKNIPKKAFKTLKKPSMVVSKKDKNFLEKPDMQLSKWKKTLSPKQIEGILKIVSDFGLDYYIDDLEPDYKKI